VNLLPVPLEMSLHLPLPMPVPPPVITTTLLLTEKSELREKSAEDMVSSRVFGSGMSKVFATVGGQRSFAVKRRKLGLESRFGRL
jgi:hypothetical protein